MSSEKSKTTTPWEIPVTTVEPSWPSSIKGTSSLFAAPTNVSLSGSSSGAKACGPTDRSGGATRRPPLRLATGTAKHSEKESSEITTSGIANTRRVGSPVLQYFMLDLKSSIGKVEGPRYLRRCKNNGPQSEMQTPERWIPKLDPCHTAFGPHSSSWHEVEPWPSSGR